MAIHYSGLIEISGGIRRREISAEEVTRALLDRIAQHDGRLGSITMLLADQALADARQADAEIASGLWRGPLHGVPLGVKDLLWTKGLSTMAGMPLLRDFKPPEDATVVQRLRRAGAVILAKLHMTEGATLNHHPDLPRPVNPWSADHWTGVSSSGSGVAPAAGLCFGAIGSDTGGSIRMPSAANNLTGIKPSWGRVSRHGLIHLSESFDHLGPMARSVEDAAAMLQAIAGADPLDPTCLPDPVPDYLAEPGRGIEDLTLGIDWTYAAGGMPDEIIAALKNALAVFIDLGVRVREITFPWNDAEIAATRPMFSADMALAHAEWFPARADEYGPWLRGTLAECNKVEMLDLVRGYRLREQFKGKLKSLFREVDLVLTPGLGRVLPTWRKWRRSAGALRRSISSLAASPHPAMSRACRRSAFQAASPRTACLSASS
jgi:amidase